jgi:hypothetical protein
LSTRIIVVKAVDKGTLSIADILDLEIFPNYPKSLELLFVHIRISFKQR